MTRAHALPRLHRRNYAGCAVESADAAARIASVACEVGRSLGEARARAGFSRGHLVDVVVYVPGGLDSATAELAVEALLGDELMDDWIGAVDAAALPRGGPLRVVGGSREAERTFPLAELPQAVRAAIDGLTSGLPDAPYLAQDRSRAWTLFELEPEPAHDYAAQDDLMLATTIAPELLKAYLQGLPIFSGRFSRAGELFCYLKLDFARTPPDAQLARRRAVEDALDAALVPAGDGCVIGNGLGLRYAYVDLALARPEAVARVAEVALAAGAPERSWLLFLDRELDGEWIGLEPVTPAPPRVAVR